MFILSGRSFNFHIHIFLFEILLFLLEKYKRDFQIYVITMIRPIMEFTHFLFEIFLFMLEE